jgi:mono/diheme cytochrome c family protein
MQWRLAVALAFAFFGASAKAQSQALTPKQAVGQRIMMTSCGLCHTPPDINNSHMAPALSRETLNGSAPDIIAFIKAGTATMPGFEYTYNDEQLAAVADYLSTVAPEAGEKKK